MRHFSIVIGFWFPRSAWEPTIPDALRRFRQRGALQGVCSHAERGNKGYMRIEK